MSSSTTKKVQIRRFQRESVSGFVNPLTYLTSDGVEFLNLNGMVVNVPYAEIKAVYFVREFEAGENEPERRAFLTRPKLDGLWVRMHFRDEDVLEGILTNNLLVYEPYGFTVVPPDFSYANQRLFIPRAALKEMQVLGVINSPLRQPKPKAPKKLPKDQFGLFDQ